MYHSKFLQNISCKLATQMVVVVVAVMVVVKTGIRSVCAGVDADGGGCHRSTQDRRVSQRGSDQVVGKGKSREVAEVRSPGSR